MNNTVLHWQLSKFFKRDLEKFLSVYVSHKKKLISNGQGLFEANIYPFIIASLLVYKAVILIKTVNKQFRIIVSFVSKFIMYSYFSSVFLKFLVCFYNDFFLDLSKNYKYMFFVCLKTSI